MRRIILVVAMVFLLAGCYDPRKEMSDFRCNEGKLLTDKEGRQWVVRHHFGQIYIVEPYKPPR